MCQRIGRRLPKHDEELKLRSIIIHDRIEIRITGTSEKRDAIDRLDRGGNLVLNTCQVFTEPARSAQDGSFRDPDLRVTRMRLCIRFRHFGPNVV